MGVWYCTREDVKSALDYNETARNNAKVDRAIEAASRTVEGLCHRKFYPWTGTRYFDWPNDQRARSWRIWLNEDEIISVSSLTSGGTAISSDDYFLEPVNDGPPYDRIEIDRASTAAFNSGSTPQRSIAVTGVFGYTNDTEPAGSAAEAMDASETAFDVTDGSLIGVGDILLVDSERMLVTGRTWLDTGYNVSGSGGLGGNVSDVQITLGASGNIPRPGETILVDSERMLVVDTTSTHLTVKRAYDGSVPATHAAGADINAARTLTVTRGALGTTAAPHDNGATILKQVIPGPIRELTIAFAIDNLLQKAAGYSRVAGSGENAREGTGRAIANLTKLVVAQYGRLRVGAV
jgi:hypothetical protein